MWELLQTCSATSVLLNVQIIEPTYPVAQHVQLNLCTGEDCITCGSMSFYVKNCPLLKILPKATLKSTIKYLYGKVHRDGQELLLQLTNYNYYN